MTNEEAIRAVIDTWPHSGTGMQPAGHRDPTCGRCRAEKALDELLEQCKRQGSVLLEMSTAHNGIYTGAQVREFAQKGLGLK